MAKQNIIKLKEYQGVCCKHSDIYQKIDEKTFKQLETFVLSNTKVNEEANGLELFKLVQKLSVGKVIIAQNYVGTINLLNGTSIEILPKIYSPEAEKLNDENIKKIFLKMLMSVKELPFKKSVVSNLKTIEMNVFEIFIKIFIEKIEVIVKRGLKSGYITCTGNENFLKGKLLLKEQLQHNFTKEKFFVEYSILDKNRSENKLLKATLLFLEKQTSNWQNKKKIGHLLDFFDDIESSINYDYDFAHCIIDRSMGEYSESLQWSKVFLLKQGFVPFTGANCAYALLFPMEILFERYIADLLQQALAHSDYHVCVQDNKYHLFEEPKQFALRPDIVIRHNDKTIVLDTKWKVLSQKGKNYGISREDMYQMYAYAKKYNAQEVILLYPLNENIDASFTLDFFTDDKKVHIKVMFVDLTLGDNAILETKEYICMSCNRVSS